MCKRSCIASIVTVLCLLLSSCTAEYRSLAEKADGHAIDVERLSEAWPQ